MLLRAGVNLMRTEESHLFRLRQIADAHLNRGRFWMLHCLQCACYSCARLDIQICI